MICCLPAQVSTSPQRDFNPAEIEAQLERILSSDAFRSSRRSQEFLRFVVMKVLAGQEDSIKERNIAIEVFQRSVDYNSSEDSFVRVKAGEVRRRLTAYNAASHPEDHLRFELPLGSYVPQFVVVDRTAEPPGAPAATSPTAPRPRLRWQLPAAILCVFAAVMAALIYLPRHHSALDEFWAPILRSSEPVVIFLPIPTSYNLVSEEFARRGTTPTWQGTDSEGAKFIFAPAPHKVGVGAAVGAIRFAALCVRTGKSYTLKAGEDFSFADLRNQPAILFGAFSSPWTEEINNEHRFKLVRSDSRIVDSRNPGRQWSSTPGRFPGAPLDDYALASRVIDSKSGRAVIIAAGISTFGTQAAAEFLTEPSRLEELSRRAPRPLDAGNFQVLLYTKILGNSPTPAKIIDIHFW